MAPQLTKVEIALVERYMYKTCGIDLSNKDYLINSKMGILCFSLGYGTFAEFWTKSREVSARGADLRQKIIDALTTNYSYFYREAEHFRFLSELLKSGSLPVHHDLLRAWSAGCSSAQEPYNLAMTLSQAKIEGALTVPYRIIASDVSATALEKGRLGHYDTADYLRLPEVWRQAFCCKIPGGCKVNRALREQVEIRLESVLNPQITEPYDFVFCRNLLIYFDKPTVAQLKEVLQRSVAPGGYLFLGHTEILNELPGFTYLQPSIYRRENDTR